MCSLWGCLPPQAPPPFTEWETVSVEQLLLPNPAGAAQLTGRWGGESQRKPSTPQPIGGGKEDRHTVAKATTFEWVCSWNAARRQLYNRLKGGVRLWRGSDKGSSWFFFHWPLFIYISQMCQPTGILPNQKHWNMSPTLHIQPLLREILWFSGLMSVTSLLCFASTCDAFRSPRTVTHVIGPFVRSL